MQTARRIHFPTLINQASPAGNAGNRFLAALPKATYNRLAAYLEPVILPPGQLLQQPDETSPFVYFPDRGIVSCVLTGKDGAKLEVDIVGREGMVGHVTTLHDRPTPSRAVVQIAGSGWRIPAAAVREEFRQGNVLQSLLLRYTQALLVQASQITYCNRCHTLEERLSRWLLTITERAESDRLPLTQEAMAEMLGLRRVSVTVAAGVLREAGLIRYSRGDLTVINRARLEACACDCYAVIHDQFKSLYQSPIL
ncbi:MAG: Crp/Fnr family transcriptional regulator [Armatimonadota bacterium]|nr:Crp/Fnr family transcriptional regulator [Armatimonadota bacterium]